MCTEAGGRCLWQPRVSRLNFGPEGQPPAPDDRRKLDVVCFGLPVFGGLPLALDATLVSPLSAEGVPHAGCASNADACFSGAEDAKRTTYAELAGSCSRCTLLCLAASTGGRWSSTCLKLVRDLARHRAESEPALLRRSVKLALQRRWWSVLSTARDEAVAASLDPRDFVDEHYRPMVHVSEVFFRESPQPSCLGLAGCR